MSVWMQTGARSRSNEIAGSMVRGIWTALRRLWLAYDVMLQRQQLSQLNDRMLHDIGITRAAADAEIARSFWDIPADQLRRR